MIVILFVVVLVLFCGKIWASLWDSPRNFLLCKWNEGE